MPFKATIDLLLDVPTFPEACDAVAEIMRENTRAHTPISSLVDWRYSGTDNDPRPVELAAIPADFCEDSNWPRVTGSSPAEKETSHAMTGPERDTILAALRFWQRKGNTSDLPEYEIFQNGDSDRGPMDDGDIDAICERINV